MQRWEYLNTLVTGEEKLTAVLTQHGADGWEMVSALHEDDAGSEPRPTYRVFFKRPFSDAFHGAS